MYMTIWNKPVTNDEIISCTLVRRKMHNYKVSINNCIKDETLGNKLKEILNARLRDTGITSTRNSLSKDKDYMGVANRNDRGFCKYVSNTNMVVEKLGIISSISTNKISCFCYYCQINHGLSRSWYITRGIYSEIASLPLGWSRYPLNSSFDEEILTKDWNLSYHGTTFEAIPSIIKDRRLRIPNNKTVHIRQGHIPNQFFIFTSPSLIYASFGLYSAPFQLLGDSRWWQVAIELLQEPRTYVKEWETSGIGSYVFDRHVGNDELEWKSSSEGSNLVRALLVREIPNEEPAICRYPSGTYFLHERDWWYQPYNGSPPFWPNEIRSVCSCSVQRGKRDNGSLCPIMDKGNYKTKPNLCTIVCGGDDITIKNCKDL
ncbi:hypothetical protein cand_036740 [Cryptosporidium andersoni]|uniref:Uncharacterized protein n=1 Tax=Cryptosporidium andersoni TaxID=117008 RepID=A0A1J4MUU4_9CRYT|nr:hypothetical protein cand_036740 [Cryptosporidium andersoni]